MKKECCSIMLFGVMILFTSCAEKTVITQDNVVRVQNQMEVEREQKAQSSESEGTFDISVWRSELPKTECAEISGKRVAIRIDADIIVPEVEEMPKKYAAQIISLDDSKKEALVKYLWGSKADDVFESQSLESSGFYQDDQGSRLLFDKTILFTRNTDKPFDLTCRSFSETQAENVEMNMEQAKGLCEELFTEIGFTNMVLVNDSVITPIDWSNNIAGGYVSEKAYYYFGYAQKIKEIPVGGWLDNQNVWNAYMGPGNRSALMNFSIDDTGIFKIQGNLYEIRELETYEKLLSFEELLQCLESQLSFIIMDGIKGKYGTTEEGIMTDIPITEIKLVYLLDADQTGQFVLEPYWQFVIGESERDGALLTNICIHAVTGEVGVCND